MGIVSRLTPGIELERWRRRVFIHSEERWCADSRLACNSGEEPGWPICLPVQERPGGLPVVVLECR